MTVDGQDGRNPAALSTTDRNDSRVPHIIVVGNGLPGWGRRGPNSLARALAVTVGALIALMMAAVVVALFVMAITATLAVVAIDRLALVVSPRRRTRRADMARPGVVRFGPRKVIDVTATTLRSVPGQPRR